MFVDNVTISIRAGNGGDGAVSFLRAKYVPNGGPDGGDGGNGGNVIFAATKNKNTLLDFKYVKKFEATDGDKGSGRLKNGKNGKDVVIEVPCGTIIKDARTNNILADLVNDGERYLALKGGRGGKGNNFFKTSTRQAPHFSQLGEKSAAYKVVLELKTIADIALVGKPNVGKSTLLSVISNAKPKIADYEFTTLQPNLGVAEYNGNSFVVADIPGLIEGANTGAGLGHDFLSHIERTRLIVHVIDGSGYYGNDPVADYDMINVELKKFSEHLSKLPQIVVLSKMDLIENSAEIVNKMQKHAGKNILVLPISSITNQNIEILLQEIVKKLKTLPVPAPFAAEQAQLHSEDISSVEIKKMGENKFILTGGYLENLQRGIVFSDPASSAYFHHRLKADGILDKLKDFGVKDGDTVIMGTLEFEMVE